MNQRFWLGCLLLLVFANPVAAAAQEQVLKEFFHTLISFKADFTQQVYSPRRELQQSSKGQVIVQRPGKFRWDFLQPYVQHIVAVDDKVWFYDVDLEQVTIKRQDASMDNTPASLLSDATQLEKQFDVMAVVRDGQDWFELVPRQADSGFEAIFIFLEDDVIKIMELHDSFGQLTLINFENVVMNQRFESNVFKLDIARGVDVIDETAEPTP